MITMDREYVYDSNGELNIKLITKTIEIFQQNYYEKMVERKEFYDGKEELFDTPNPSKNPFNVKGVVNFAKEITDLIVGYLHGKPVTYNYGDDNNAKELCERWFSIINEDSHNKELGKDMSIYGKAFELIIMQPTNEDGTGNKPKLFRLSPKSTFIVYDTEIDRKPMYGVTICPHKTLDNTLDYYKVLVYTEDSIYTYKSNGSVLTTLTLLNVEQHNFGGIPIIEYLNNKDEKNDFDCVKGLILYYNNLLRNRVVDKQNFISQLLVIVGDIIGDDERELTNFNNLLKKYGIINIPYDGDGKSGDAKFISQTFDESQVEILSKAISKVIHQVANIPDLSDEQFSGSGISGISLAFKTMGTEQLSNSKEIQFKSGLMKRLILINNVMSKIGKGFNVYDISISMSRNLFEFKTFSERLQELQGTEGILSLKTRLKTFRPELDVDTEIEELKKEKLENMQMMAQAYNPYQNNNGAIVEDRNNLDVPKDDKKDNDKKDNDKKELEDIDNVNEK